MDVQNHYYGHSAVLAAYAGVKGPRHLNGVLQHGFSLTNPVAIQMSGFARMPGKSHRFVWSQHSRGWTPSPELPTTGLGAPWLYLVEGHRDLAFDMGPGTGGTVVYPVHGTKGIDVDFSVEDFAREVAEREGPATICLLEAELNDPEAAGPWLRHGHSLVSSGDPKSPEFILRTAGIISGASKVVSNQLTSAMLYAASISVPTEIYGPEAVFWGHFLAMDRIRELWPEFSGDATVAERQAVALSELGHPHLLDPAGLRKLVGWDRRHLAPAWRYWVTGPAQKAATTLGLQKRVTDDDPRAKAPSQGAPPSSSGLLRNLKNPFNFLPKPLQRGSIDLTAPLPEPLRPTPLASASGPA